MRSKRHDWEGLFSFHVSAHDSEDHRRKRCRRKGKLTRNAMKCSGDRREMFRLSSSLNHSPGCPNSSHAVLPGKIKEKIFCDVAKGEGINKKTSKQYAQSETFVVGQIEYSHWRGSLCTLQGPLPCAVSLTFVRLTSVSSLFRNFQDAPAERWQC